MHKAGIICFICSALYFCSCITAETKKSTDEHEILSNKNKNSNYTENNKNSDSVYDTDSIDYEAFKSYFSDLTLGKKHDTGNRLPNHPFIKDYFTAEFTPEDIQSGAKLEIYAVGKITGYKGLDLYILEEIDIRPDEDSYDNHSDNNRFLMVVKDGKPLKNKEDNFSELRYAFNYSYYGEGGEGEYTCYFDIDTTIIAIEYRAESESATGFSTPIVSNKEYRWTIKENGDKELLEVIRLEFSSDFYHESFIKKNKQYWDSNDSYRNYPSEDHKLWIYEKLTLFENIELMNFPMNIHFCYREIDGQLRLVFESAAEENNKLIDSYIWGSSKRKENDNIESTKRCKLLKCPFIIKTSDGNIEITPDGKFFLLE